MTLKELARKIELLIEADVYRGDAIVTFGPRDVVIHDLKLERTERFGIVVARLVDTVLVEPGLARNFDPLATLEA